MASVSRSKRAAVAAGLTPELQPSERRKTRGEEVTSPPPLKDASQTSHESLARASWWPALRGLATPSCQGVWKVSSLFLLAVCPAKSQDFYY